jgi:hypothetical protein
MQCHVKDTLVADGDDFGILRFLSWSFKVGSLLHELHSNEINLLWLKGLFVNLKMTIE